MSEEKILIRIQKLVAMRDGAAKVGNQAEAEAFAAKVQDLLMRHKLSMSDVELARQKDDDPVGETLYHPVAHGRKSVGRRVAWQERLASAVARAHFCRIYVWPGSNVVTFVGRESDRLVAVWMFTTLADTAERLAKEAKRQVSWLDDSPEFRQSWLRGFVAAIASRYAESRKAAERSASERGVALIRLADNAVTEYMEKKASGKAAPVGRGSVDAAAYAAGQRAGSQVSLDSRGVRSGTGARGHIGGAA